MVEIEQKRYADDITLQELVRLRVENERLREALQGLLRVADGVPMSGIDAEKLTTAARSALQQKGSE